MKSEPGDERVTRSEDYLEDVYIYKNEEAQYPLEIDFGCRLFKLNKNSGVIYMHDFCSLVT